MLSTHLVTEKTFWIQLIALFLSAVSLQGLWLNPSKGLCPWTYVDILPLSLLGLILLSYPYSIHPEPEKLLFIGQMVVLWYLLRQVFHEYPVLIGYFSMFFIATGLIEAIWGFRQLQGWAYSNHSLFRLTGSFSIRGLIPDIWRSHYRWLLASCWNSPNEICPITCPWDV